MFNDDNVPTLTMSDTNNRIRLKMDTTDGGAELSLYNQNLTRRMLLAATDKESYLWINNSKGEKQVRLGSQLELSNPDMIESYGAYMKLYNKSGVPVVKLHADEYGYGVMGAYNQLHAGNELKPGPYIVK